MKKLIFVSLLLVPCLGAASADQFLQASSSITQCPGMAPEVVQMDITDAASGITLADNKVTLSEAGPYLIVAAPLGCFDLWLRVNGVDVANSNVQLCQDEGSMAKDVINFAGDSAPVGRRHGGSDDVGQ